MIVKLPTEHHLKFLSLKGGCRGSSESTLVKISNCWKSHAAAQLFKNTYKLNCLHLASYKDNNYTQNIVYVKAIFFIST